MTQAAGGTPSAPSRSRRRNVAQLVAVILLTVAVPLAIRLVHGRTAAAVAATSRVPYLPAFPGHRSRPFHAARIPELRQMNPGAVVIGDSMAGTRIDERVLSQLAGVPVAPLLQAGSGSAFWYLALKNWVVASGIKPRVVFIFFRDTNLTDVMFRLDDQYRWSLDMVAGETEDELNDVVQSALDGPFYAVHQAAERVYQVDAARRAVEPVVSRAPAAWVARSADDRSRLLEQANQRFGLDHLRVMEAADMAADPGTDFAAVVGQSVLPLMLRDARRAGFKLCLVRVQRRPVGGQPPAQSAALRKYMRDLREYVQSHGGILHDDTGDPAITLDMYEDGDHIARHARAAYTRLFYERLRVLFRPAPPVAGPAGRAQ
jgi:hypothetical protein